VALLASLGFLPVLGAWDLVGALPALAQNLLSNDPILYRLRVARRTKRDQAVQVEVRHPGRLTTWWTSRRVRI